MELARRMIKVAKECGAGSVKFQLYNAEDDRGKSYYDIVKQSELTFDQAKMLFGYGAEIGIEVFFSVFGVQYVEWCERIGVGRYKIACHYRDKAVINALLDIKKPVYISVDESVKSQTPMEWFWLWCVSEYPAIVKGMSRTPFPYYTGFSDHSIGIEVTKIALARGAQIIEKHFTLDRSLPGPDQAWSMEPDELRELVRWDKVCQEVL